MEALREITQFLSKSARLDLKAVSLTHVLGLTGSKDGISLISQCPELLANVVDLCADEADTIRKDAVLSLVNLSAEQDGAEALVKQVGLDRRLLYYISYFISGTTIPLDKHITQRDFSFFQNSKLCILDSCRKIVLTTIRDLFLRFDLKHRNSI